MVFNVTFNNISVISWWSVLLVEETGNSNYYTITTTTAPTGMIMLNHIQV